MNDFDDQHKIDQEFKGPPQKGGFFKRQDWHDENPGYKVVTILFIICYGISLTVIYSFIGRREIGAFHFIVLFLGTIPAYILSQMIWRGIGSQARDILRLMAKHWVMSLFGIVFVFHIINNTISGIPLVNTFKGQGMMEGDNWFIPVDEQGQYLKLTPHQAREYCKTIEGSWRQMHFSDLEYLVPAPVGHNKKMFWLGDLHNTPKTNMYFRYEKNHGKVEPKKGAYLSSDSHMASVICVRQ